MEYQGLFGSNCVAYCNYLTKIQILGLKML